MLRYIYLLCFIINFELVFCYNYINSQTSRVRESQQVARKKDQREKPRESRLKKREDYGFEDGLVDQIDVAGFIQKPDYDYAEPYRYDGKRPPKSHNIFRAFEESYPGGLPRDRREPLPSRPHGRQAQAPIDPPELTPLTNELNARVEGTTLSNYQERMLMDRQLVHNPKKKCSLTKMFPFFSHNKAVHDKKGTKKKKPCDNCSKKVKQHHEPFTESEVNLRKKKKKQERSTEEARIKKRYAEQICPKCKMEYTRMRKKRWDLPKIIHNSRQYYASLNNAPKETVETSSKRFDKVNIRKRFDDNNVNEDKNLIPGQDYRSQNREQFKTLEDLERKVDSVEI